MADLTGIITNARTGKPIISGSVRVFSHTERNDRNWLGSAKILSGGKFKIKWKPNAPAVLRQPAPPSGGPWLFLRIYDQRGRLIHETASKKGRARFRPWKIRVSDRRLPDSSVRELRETLGLPQNVETKLTGKGLSRVTQMLTPDGRKAIRELSLSTDNEAQLLRTAELALVTGDAKLAKRLLDSGYTDVSKVANKSVDSVIKTLEETGSVTEEEKSVLVRSNQIATVVTESLKDDIVISALREIWDPNGSFGHGPPLGMPEEPKAPDTCRQCDYKDSVFSPLAYIYEFVHFLDDNWGLGLERVESIMLQELDYDAETFLAPVAQVRLAVEVLEKYLMDELGEALDATWTEAFRDMVRRAFVDLGMEDPAQDTEIKKLLQHVGPTTTEFDQLNELLAEMAPDLFPKRKTGGERSKGSPFGIREETARRSEAEAVAAAIASPVQLLIQYRDSLRERIMDVLKDRGEMPHSLDALGQALFVDLQASSCQLTTRATHAIQSLQLLVQTVRGDRLSQVVKLRFKNAQLYLAKGIAPEIFDKATWHWLRSYASWNAAMYALVYPENVISALQREGRSQLFQESCSKLRGAGATNEVAEKLHERYREQFRLLADIDNIDAHILDGVLHMFVCSETKLFYASTDVTALHAEADDEEDVSSSSLQTWKEVVGWPEGVNPRYALSYHSGDSGGFIVTGHDREESQNRTFRVSLDGIFKGEAEFEVALDGEEGSSSTETKLIGVFLGEKADTDSHPTLWGWKSPGDDGGLWYRALLNQSTGTWRGWKEGPDNANPDRPKARVSDERWSINSNETTIKLLRSKNDGSRELVDVEGARGTDFFVAWNRELGQLWSIVFQLIDGGLKASHLSIVDSVANLSPGARISQWLGDFADDDTWPSSLDPSSPVARHPLVLERYLLFPLLAGQSLNRAGDYESTHRWFLRLFKPYGASEKEVFPFSSYFYGEGINPTDWYADATNPHAVAMRRAGTYQRCVLLGLVKNLLDWAEHELSLNDPESRNRSRELFVSAKNVLSVPELQNFCGEEIERLAAELSEGFSQTDELSDLAIRQLLASFLSKLQDLQDRTAFDDAVKKVRALLRQTSQTSLAEFLEKLQSIIREAQKTSMSAQPNVKALLNGGQLGASIEIKDASEEIISEFLHAPTRGNFPVRRVSLGTAVFSGLCVPPNPLMRIFADRADLGLSLLRQCLDATGESQLLPTGSLYGRAIDTFSSEGTFNVEQRSVAPRYRYGFLADKARQYTSLAQQLEASMLAAIEKRDSAALAMLQAEIAKEVASATVTLKQSALSEASLGVDIALIQSLQASHQKAFWEVRTTRGSGPFGLSNLEMTGLSLMGSSGLLQGLAATGQFLLAGPAAQLAGTSTFLSTTGAIGGLLASPSGYGAVVGAGALFGGLVGLAASAVTGGQHLIGGLQSASGALGIFGNLSLTTASFQRRWEDWLLQAKLADFGEQVAAKQLDLANERKATLEQEKAIADLQENHADRVIEFHKNRFSNEELYQWMIRVLQDAYRSVMQSATAMALQAQGALAFERQQQITEILGDYWSIDEASLTDEQKRSGLTGAERLYAALTRLDEWKVNTDKRRLQLSKTISLARFLPGDFETTLKQTGQIDFMTLLDWFDRDFPGHYLRLIKSVKVTVIALVPPTEGIHATLSNNGISNVVLQDAGGGFVKDLAVVTRLPESVALDSPYNDTGLFVLDYRDPMLLPFEGLGVETGWTFELPTATNRFDYDTLVDVLFTIEYTALASGLYKQQVIERLGTTQGMELVISLRTNYIDEWYHLMNPENPAVPQTVVLDLPERTFPKSNGGKGRPGIEHMTVLMIGDNCENLPHGAAAIVSIMKKGFKSKFENNRSDEISANADGALGIGTDSNSAFSTRDHTYVDGNGMPNTVFAVDSSEATSLLHPKDVISNTELELLDPAGEWEIVFDSSWFSGDQGSRRIDQVRDIVLVPSVQYEVKW